MQGNNKSFRIRTNIGDDSNVHVNLTQDYDTFEILSLKINTDGVYKLHNSNYGVVVGRVLANNGFGVPNAKISIFIEAEFDESVTNEMMVIYPFSYTSDVNYTGKRYNLLPDDEVDECHQTVGSFPNKTYLLDNDAIIEVFDKYYKYTTRTNNSGDYIICGVPVGNQTLHMDLDLSDCGILSQRPRDFVYKGYTIEQFENPNQFKISDDLDSLSQIISQNQPINVIPFWGDANEVENVGITRADIKVSFTFEPTCVFMGCIAGDNQSNGISKKCIPTEQMGAMDELVTGEGTIEMIRKTMSGDVEEFQIKGTQLINGNGVWCYQIPMNLDYVATDEYGNTVATDDPSKGIPTRAQVRFRISMQETEQNMDNYFRAKVLVPHNPENEGELDYNFGTKTKDSSYRDLFWNNVYTVKSYIPRFQKSKRWKNERFSGIKHCNIYGNNNPIPYNNIRIKLPFMFIILCALIKGLIKIITFINRMQGAFIRMIHIVNLSKNEYDIVKDRAMKCTYIGDGMCPDLDGWYFAPGCTKGISSGNAKHRLLEQTLQSALKNDGDDPDGYASTDYIDETSIDYNNSEEESACLTTNIDYFVSCIEMNLAQEYKVIQFDFYNDWLNGMIYMPRWVRQITKKRSYLFGLIKIKPKTKGCFNDSSRFGSTRYYTQQCSLGYKPNENDILTKITTSVGCKKNKQDCHKKHGMAMYGIFGKNGGIVNEFTNMNEQSIYYFKPCEWTSSGLYKRVILFANDIVLLGSLNGCDNKGIPQAFKYLSNSSYKLPTNLALTNMDDNGYLYANSAGTICNNTSDVINENSVKIGISQLDSTFANTKKYSQGAIGGSENDNYVTYVNWDDVIPITEAAGIAWNYTGPGQGVASNKSVYNPGGHFLGLSCRNSQTNIKSCINLQRICELGVNMSQRREYLKQIDKDGDNITYTLAYHIPTGFIGKDEIIGGDFRSMFATLNTSKLIANGIDENTGYPIYNFKFLKPNNFNGEFHEYVADPNGDYMSYQGENDTLRKRPYNMDTFLIKNGAIDEKENLKITGPYDYDLSEVFNSSTRTIEDTSMDYYLFRYGLTLDNYSSKQYSKFLGVDNSGGYILPQYENSYYFYFGLKEGATALDEFFKDFFSNCNDGRRRAIEPEINIEYEDNVCTMTSNVTVEVSNMSPSYTYILNKNGNVMFNGVSALNKFIIDDVPFGTYNISVTDSINNVITETIVLGENVIDLMVDTEDFSFKTTMLTPTEISKSGETSDSGYIIVDRRINVDGTYYDIINNQDSIALIISNLGDNNKGYVVSNKTQLNDEDELVDVETTFTKDNPYINSGIQKFPFRHKLLDDGSKVKIYVWANDSYEIYVGYKCSGYKPTFTLYTNAEVNSLGEFDLIIGNSEYLSYNKLLNKFDGEWWKDKNNLLYNDNDYNNDSNKPIGWLLRHFLFNQNTTINTPFNVNIMGYSKGDKMLKGILFGEPEYKEDDVYKIVNEVYSTEGVLPDGTSLTDSSIFVPTWTYDNSIPLRKYFSKTIIDEDRSVLGDALDDVIIESVFVNTIENIIIFDYSTTNPKIVVGDGCIIENDGMLYYPTIVNENTMIYKMHFVPLVTIDREKCKVYLPFKFPVIYKPFSFEANFMETGFKSIKLLENGQPTWVYVNNNFTCDGILKNGITYNGKFGTSYINGNIVDIKGNNDILTNENDELLIVERVYGLDKSEDSPFFNKNYNEQSYKVSFKEGAPENYASNPKLNTPVSLTLKEIDGEIRKGNFYDYILHDISEDMVRFNGYPNNIEDDIKYYKIDLTTEDGKPLSKNTQKLFYCVDESNRNVFTAYIGGKINEKAVEGVINDEIFVKVKWDSTRQGFVLTYGDNVSTEILSNGRLSDYYEGYSNRYEGFMNEIANEFISELNKIGVDTLPVIDINASSYMATTYVNKIKERGVEIKTNGSETYSYNEGKFMIVGMKEYIMENGVDISRIVRIYPESLHENWYYDGSIIPYFDAIISIADDYIFPYNGGNGEIQINTNIMWYTETNNNSISFNPSEGDGSNTITFTITKNKEKNNDESENNVAYTESEIIVKTTDGSFVKTFIVKQYKSPADKIEFNLETLTMNYGEVKTLSLTTNNEWYITTDVDWLKVNPYEGGIPINGNEIETIDINIENTYSNTDENGVGTITANIKNNNSKKAICTINANKLLPEITLLSENEKIMEWEDNLSFEITFASNVGWKATYPNWIELSKDHGGKGDEITITALLPKRNPTNASRVGEIIITTNVGDKNIIITVTQKTELFKLNVDLSNTLFEFGEYIWPSDMIDGEWDKDVEQDVFGDTKEMVKMRKGKLILSSDSWDDFITIDLDIYAGWNAGEPAELRAYAKYGNEILVHDNVKRLYLGIADEEKFIISISGGSSYALNHTELQNKQCSWYEKVTLEFNK